MRALEREEEDGDVKELEVAIQGRVLHWRSMTDVIIWLCGFTF